MNETLGKDALTGLIYSFPWESVKAQMGFCKEVPEALLELWSVDGV